jgi:hypothetical protein
MSLTGGAATLVAPGDGVDTEECSDDRSSAVEGWAARIGGHLHGKVVLVTPSQVNRGAGAVSSVKLPVATAPPLA